MVTYHDSCAWVDSLDVSLHLVEPSSLEAVEKSVDEDDNLFDVGSSSQALEARRGLVIGHVLWLQLAGHGSVLLRWSGGQVQHHLGLKKK